MPLKGTEESKARGNTENNLIDNGIKIEGKRIYRTLPNKANNSQTENKSTSSSKSRSTSSAACKSEPVNGYWDFIQQWPIIQIPGSLPLSLHRTYKSTSMQRDFLDRSGQTNGHAVYIYLMETSSLSRQ